MAITQKPTQNFGNLASINYDTVPAMAQAGLERLYQSDKDKDNRFRSKLAEFEGRRNLDNANSAKIASALNNNKNIMKSLMEAPEEIQKQTKKFLEGGSNSKDKAYLLTYIADMEARSAAAAQAQQKADLNEINMMNATERLVNTRKEALAEVNKSQELAKDQAIQKARDSIMRELGMAQAEGNEVSVATYINTLKSKGIPITKEVLDEITVLQDQGLLSSKNTAEAVEARKEAEDEAKAAEEQMLKGVRTEITNLQTADRAVRTIVQLMQNIGENWFGMSTGPIKFGANKNAIREQLASIQAIEGFGKLQNIRENSPTGGAVGNVSDRENELLQSTSGALAGLQDLSGDDMMRGLAQYMYAKQRTLSRQFDYYTIKYGSQKEAELRLGLNSRAVAQLRKELDEYEKTPDYRAIVGPSMGGMGWRDTQKLLIEGQNIVKPSPLPTTAEASIKEFTRKPRNPAIDKYGQSMGNFTLLNIQ